MGPGQRKSLPDRRNKTEGRTHESNDATKRRDFGVLAGDSGPGHQHRPANAQRERRTHLPPHLPPDTFGPPFERPRLARELVGLVDEELDALASAENLVDVIDHDVLDVPEICLRLTERIGGRLVRVLLHKLAELGLKIAEAVGVRRDGDVGGVRGRELGQQRDQLTS